MARIDLSGLEIAYELLGPENGPAAVITPGGRFPYDTPGVPQLGEKLAEAGWRVLLWDRPNCGGSDISFDGPSESGMQADALVALIRALDLGPIAVLGGSAGSRVSLIAAARAPELVSKLGLWWISGGAISLAQLGSYYTGESAMAAAAHDMEAVADLPGWAEQMRRNPRNRDIVLRQERGPFIARMQQWAAAFAYSERSPVPGMEPEDFRRLTMPALIFRSGESDLSHTRRTSEWVAELLPDASLAEPPWGDQEWNQQQAGHIERGDDLFGRWPLLAPQLLEFLQD